MKYTVLLPAAGSGKRMGAGQNKLFLKLQQCSHFNTYFTVFEQDHNVKHIVLAVKKEEQDIY